MITEILTNKQGEISVMNRAIIIRTNPKLGGNFSRLISYSAGMAKNYIHIHLQTLMIKGKGLF